MYIDCNGMHKSVNRKYLSQKFAPITQLVRVSVL